jgi:uncharacterized protein YuzE
MMRMAHMTYSKDADAVYIFLREDVTIVRTRNLDGSRLIDYAQDGEPIGVELLDVSEGKSRRSARARTYHSTARGALH